MKKTVKINGISTKIDFKCILNSSIKIASINNAKEGDLISINGYDYIINGTTFKIVATTLASRPTKNILYIGSLNCVTKIEVPELLHGQFPNNQKKVIEAILSIKR